MGEVEILMTGGRPATFGQGLRAIRRRRGLSQTELAKRADMSPSYLSDLERDERGAPTAPVLERLADALGVTIDTLVGRPPTDEHDVVSLYSHGTSRKGLPDEAKEELRRFEEWLFHKYGVDEGDED